MGVFHGHEGIRAFFREWRHFFAEYWAEPEEFVDAGESVIVRVRQGGRGRASTVGVEMPAYRQLYPPMTPAPHRARDIASCRACPLCSTSRRSLVRAQYGP
jgi:hypothetical protein